VANIIHNKDINEKIINMFGAKTIIFYTNGRGKGMSATPPTEFKVNAFTRENDDVCSYNHEYRESVGPGRYAVTNLIPERSTVVPQALSNPTVIAAEGFGFDQKEIDTDSVMRNNPTLEGRSRCPLRVQSRPFATVPFMAGGRGNQELESKLQQSEFVRTGKECGTVSEVFLSGQFTPLIPHLQNNVQNPKNLVPEVAASGWLRGGIPSRQYVKDLNC
jgi:hypothetical protein